MSYRYNPLSGKIEFVGISTADGTSLEATINEKVANLVDSAPTTLDTLNELASALNNDPNFATSTANLIGTKADTSSLSAVATSGAYADLTGKPSVFDGDYNNLTNQPSLFDGDYDSLTNKPSLFDGDYDSLANKPTIPTVPANVSEFANDSGFITGYTVTESDVTGHESALTITESQISDLGSYLVSADLNGYATEAYVGAQGFITGYTVTESDVTGHQSALSITESQISDLGTYLVASDLSGYATEAYVGSQGFITGYTVTQSDVTDHQTALSITESQISDLGSYLVASDLSTYALKTYVDTQVAGVVDSAPETLNTLNELSAALGNDPDFATSTANLIGTKANSADLSTVATSGAYSDLSGTPTNVSSFTNDSGYITGYTVTQTDVTDHQAALSITESQISDLQSYLTSVSEASVTAHQAALTITESQISDLQSYLTTVSESAVTAHQSALSITESQISDLGTYLVAADLSTYATQAYVGAQGFITGYTVTQSDVTGHESALTITESQISDLGSYLTTATATSDYALKTYVDTQVAGVVDSAPETLNTLNELSTALGDDPNFATTISNQIGTKANSADLSAVATSGAYGDLSGTPTNVSSFTNDSGYITGYTVTESDVTGHQSALSITESQISDFGTYLVASDLSGYATEAYVGSQGFITGYTVTQSDVTGHQAALSITESQIIDLQAYLTVQLQSDYNQTDSSAADFIKNKPSLFDGAYSSLSGTPTNVSSFTNDSGYITDYVVTQSDVTGHQAALSITESQISDLGTYLVAADLSGYATEAYVGSQGFITGYTVTQSDVTGHQAALSITESQISDLGSYVTLAESRSGVSVNSVSASGSGSLNYNNTDGVLTFAPADLSSYLVASDLSTYALKTYVDSQVAGVVSSAPETLDTLNELAAALGDDPNFATTVSNQIGTKAAVGDFNVSLGSASGSGSLNYNDAGTFTFNPPDLSSYLTTVAFADLTSKPTTISGYGITDAFDGDYNSLTNQPVIPEGADLTGYATETYVNSQGFITGISFANVSAKPTTIAGYGITDAFSGAYGDLTGAPTLFDGAYSSLSGSPTDLSDFANDTNFITLAGVSVSTGSASGSGSLNYDNSTGVFSFAPADLSSFLTSASLSAYATETYVDTQVASVVSSAPETLNTLNELADALGDDPNFATTVSNQIGTKAALTDISVSTVAASGSGSLNYDNSTGTFSFAPPELSSYLTSFTEQDPVFTSHVASGITPIHISNWNTAYGYGDHSAAGYLTASSITDKIELDDISVTTVSAAGSGSLNYTNSTGVFTFAPADLSSYLELTNAPSTSKGSPGDAVGDVAMDNDYIYRCIANYTDGNADIWKRVEFSTDTW